MRWRNVKTGAFVEGPEWLAMPQGIYEVVSEEANEDDAAVQEQADSECCEEAPLDGEPPCFDAQDDADGEISSADW